MAAQEVRERVKRVMPRGFPRRPKQPSIQKFDTGATPILQIAVSGDLRSARLTKIADKQIKERIESVSGVGQIQIVGGADARRSRCLGRSGQDAFVQRHGRPRWRPRCGSRTSNCRRAASEGSQELTVRTMGKIKPPEFNDVVGRRSRRLLVRVKDIAEAVDGQEELRSARS